MFKKFFKAFTVSVKTYVEKRGIIRSICNAIEGILVSTVLGRFVIQKIKTMWARHKAKKLGIYNKISDIGVYDDHGYRLTNEELYRKNMKTMQECENLYTDEIRECVKLIEKYEPKQFKGMKEDQKFKWVKKHNCNANDLRKKYGLDKESQIKKAIKEGYIDPAEDFCVYRKPGDNRPINLMKPEDLQKVWDQPEIDKIGIASRNVPADYEKPKKRPKGAKKGITLCSVVDYSMMEDIYHVSPASYSGLIPPKDFQIRREQFDNNVLLTNAIMNYVYAHDEKKWMSWMKKTHDPTKIWMFLMAQLKDNPELFEELRGMIMQNADQYQAEAMGYRKSNRPPIKSIEDDQLYEKLEEVLERLDDIEMKRKCNTPLKIQDAELEAEYSDEDEDDDDQDFDEDYDGVSDMEGTEYILDELDALRNGETDGKKEEDSEAPVDLTPEEVEHPENIELHKREPVKMITREDLIREAESDDQPDYELIDINPGTYTIEERAKKILLIYNKLYQEDHQLANVTLTNCLEDINGKNYAIFEKSNMMKENRRLDREHNLPWKMIHSDYNTNDERMNAWKAYQAATKAYGVDTWKQMVAERTEYYKYKFEYETVDAILNMLHKMNFDHQVEIGLVSCLRYCGDDYVNNIKASDSADVLDEIRNLPDEELQTLNTDSSQSHRWIEC